MKRSLNRLGGVAGLTLVLCIAACSDSPPAGNEDKSDGDAVAPSPIATRQAGFKKIGAANKAIGDTLKTEAPSAELIRTNAGIIAELAPQVHTWFPEGSGPGSGQETAALPAVWERRPEFDLRTTEFTAATAALEAAVSAGDPGQVRTAAEALGQTCKSCHTAFRAKK
ncbi:cytochrome c [Rhizobium sp. CRIBSB]|nr:cytochrome c [Rhizobium sp. CRIBSB]